MGGWSAIMISAVGIEEASHAVIAERLGRAVRAITIVPSGRYDGTVHLDEQRIPSDASSLRRLRLRLRTDGIVMLAGSVGRAAYTHEPVCELLRSSGASDLGNARRCATAFALSLPQWDSAARYQLFDDWLTETRRLVRENWPTILTLARVLALNGTLQAADVCRVIMLADRQAA